MQEIRLLPRQLEHCRSELKNCPYRQRLYYYPADERQGMLLLEVVAYRLSSPTRDIDEPSISYTHEFNHISMKHTW